MPSAITKLIAFASRHPLWTILLICCASISGLYVLALLRTHAHRRAYQVSNRHIQKQFEEACKMYKLAFGKYPPDKTFARGQKLNSSASLVYFLTTTFRVNPDTSKGEVAASKDAGPFISPSVNFVRYERDQGYCVFIGYGNRAIEYDNLRDDPDGFEPREQADPREEAGWNYDTYDLFTIGSDRPDLEISNKK